MCWQRNIRLNICMYNQGRQGTDGSSMLLRTPPVSVPAPSPASDLPVHVAPSGFGIVASSGADRGGHTVPVHHHFQARPTSGVPVAGTVSHVEPRCRPLHPLPGLAAG